MGRLELFFMSTKSRINNLRALLLLFFVICCAGSCVYYNTFFHARKAFNEAEKTRRESPYGQPRINTSLYQKAIEKSLKVVENYPDSKWYDDALYVLAISYFYTREYGRAERRCREILANHADSKYAKEAKLYLAKSWLEQNYMSDAMQLFEELFNTDIDRKYKAEAAMALGMFHYEDKRYDEAAKYFLAIRDSLGNEQEKRIAQTHIADGYFEMFQFQDALGAYLQILGMNPDTREKYHALNQAAVCSYRMLRIEAGMDYLQTLIKDEVYFDSVGVLKLMLAEGYEMEEDLVTAESIYEEVATQEQKKQVAAEAYYNLGLMYQFDYDNLTKAKQYYDKVVELDRGSEIGQDALQRSSDIGKLSTYAEAIEIDSSATEQMINNAAHTQYQLAELYWFKLNKPDTAILEMQFLIDSFPTAAEVPNAMIALSQMIKSHEEDTAKADSILRAALEQYPHSDYAPEIMDLLNLRGTEADTGYAELYIEKAEDFLLDEGDVDSARTYYQYVVDNFPDSKFNVQARFALIWLTETYASPGDSSVILAYAELADSFPGTYWASEATKRMQYTPRQPAPGQPPPDTTQYAEAGEDTLGISDTGSVLADTTGYIDPLKAYYIAPDGSTAIDLPASVKIIEVREPFVFPTEAYSMPWETDFELVFQIFLDFTGKVEDYVLLTPSGSEELDRRAIETLESTTFDVGLLLAEEQGVWYVYRYRVELPEELR
jgi:tetratricopeptide (TPR) repeat protein